MVLKSSRKRAKKVQPKPTISFQGKIETLFNFHHQNRLKPVDYLAIRKQTSLSLSNIHRLYKSKKVNPRMTTIKAILRYFDTPWAYLDCTTREECWAYLATLQQGASAKTLAHGMRSYGLSRQAADIVANLILFLWRKEKDDKRTTNHLDKEDADS